MAGQLEAVETVCGPTRWAPRGWYQGLRPPSTKWATFTALKRVAAATCRGRSGSESSKAFRRPSPRVFRVLTVSSRSTFSGPETAFVKVECSLHPRYFTDYLKLLKLPRGLARGVKTFRTKRRAW